MPFHAAEQHRKEQSSDSAEYPARGINTPEGVRLSDVACSLRAARGSSTQSNQVIGCPFFGSFLWANKEMNIKNEMMILFK
jgi:hypothetical protein